MAAAAAEQRHASAGLAQDLSSLQPLVVLFCDSDRVGRGERSRASDACERRMRLLAWTERISYAEALPCSAAENSSPLSLRLYIRYGSSISISIDLSLIHGISVVTVVVADGENVPYCST